MVEGFLHHLGVEVTKNEIFEEKSVSFHHGAFPRTAWCDIQENHTNFESRIRLYPL